MKFLNKIKKKLKFLKWIKFGVSTKLWMTHEEFNKEVMSQIKKPGS